jgi:hypothetical protein
MLVGRLRLLSRVVDVSMMRVVWAIVRVPAALVVLYLLRDLITTRLIDPTRLTQAVIEIGSVPVARIICFFVFAGVLTALCLSARRLGEWAGYLVPLIGGSALVVVLYRLTATPLVYSLPTILLLATNLMPDRLYDRLLPASRQNAFMAVAVGAAELFFLRRYIDWVFGGRWALAFRKSLLAAVVPAVVLASLPAALFLRSPLLVRTEQALRMPSSVRILARGNFNWAELDETGQYLFMTGHGVPRILRYDVRDFTREPIKASAESGGAQDFAYDAAAAEIYAFNVRTNQLQIFDARSLELKRSLSIADLSEGDPWIAADGKTNTITLVSEADTEEGHPFLVLDRTTGAVRDKRNLDAGNMLLDPDTSRLYLSFFRRRNSLLVYDLRSLSVVVEVPAPHHVDRMTFLRSAREVLLVAPVESRIYRYDIDTLAAKGHFDAMFGVRALAVDPKRNVLLCGSLVNGIVAVIDLSSGRTISRFYLGPWLRTIVVDAPRGVAYVSSHDALYELRY